MLSEKEAKDKFITKCGACFILPAWTLQQTENTMYNNISRQ